MSSLSLSLSLSVSHLIIKLIFEVESHVDVPKFSLFVSTIFPSSHCSKGFLGLPYKEEILCQESYSSSYFFSMVCWTATESQIFLQ